MKDIISTRDLSRGDFDTIIEEALELKKQPKKFKKSESDYQRRRIASLFFEPSTRTRISSETAAEMEDLFVNGFAGTEGTSVKKGEPLADTVRMFQGYVYDAVVMRHNLEGGARLAADYLSIPVINGGDGANGHPTQTMLDLMTIKENFGTIDGLKVALVGDLRNGRTVHSLLQALESYDVEPWLISPSQVSMPDWRVKEYQKNTGKQLVITPDLVEAIKNVDVVYMTRIQRERFAEGPEGKSEYEKVSGVYRITKKLLEEAKKGLIVMHPLPRYKQNLEITMDVDATPQARYFEQATNGMYMRQAIWKRIFGEGFEGKPGMPEHAMTEDLPIREGSEKKGQYVNFRNGTSIDHLELGIGKTLGSLLGIDNYKDHEMILGRFKSSRYGMKEMLMLYDVELNPEQLYKLALVSQNATVNYICDGKVVRKFKPQLPNELDGLVACQNPNCISRPEHYEHAPSKFYVEDRAPLTVRCHYCERPVGRKDIKLL